MSAAFVFILALAAMAAGTEAQLVGGFHSIDAKSAEVMAIANFATSTIGQSMNDEKGMKLIKIVSAESQVVAGTNYKLELELQGSSGRLSCEALVFDQPWTNTRELTTMACKPDALVFNKPPTTN